MHCDGLPGPVLVIPPPRLLLSGGDGALGGRGGDCYVRGWGKFALGQCSGLPGPALVIPLPRQQLPGSGGAAGGQGGD